MRELSSPTQKLIERYQFWYHSLQPKETIPTIHVDEVASTVASFYEKIRGVVEWKEEHLLRRAAIARVLKRRMILQKTAENLAEPFVFELIRNGHFPNDQIPEEKIEEVKRTLNKYFFILENSPIAQHEKWKAQLYDWLLNLAACEIEEILSPAIKEKALIEYMTELMMERIEVAKGMKEEEKNIQVFIACQKALFKLDSPIISYYLLQKKYSDWSKLSESQLQKISTDIYSIWETIEKELNHPLAEKFYQICEQYDIAYLLVGDVVGQNPFEAQRNLSQPEILEGLIKSAYQTRLNKLKARIGRAAFYSTISIFITKILFALAIEIPFDKYILGEFNRQSLMFNVFFPPFLMFLLVLTIRPPKKENLNRVTLEAMKIVHKTEKKEIYPIKIKSKKGVVLNLLVFSFYFLNLIISFGVVIWVLRKLNFGILSMVIFLMFFSLISFTGTKIRERAKELTITNDRSGFFSFLFDSFSLPFLRLGRWLSNQWSRFNLVVVLITALIDMPLQLFVEFLEHWRTFLKEKKEEIH